MEWVNTFAKNELELIRLLSWLMVVSGAALALTLLCGSKSAYGRYAFEALQTKISLPARWAWFLQEAPPLVFSVYYLLTTVNQGAPFLSCNKIVLMMFIVYFVQRALIYPFLIKGGKSTPFHVFLMAFVFCCWNGYIQSAYHSLYASYKPSHLTQWTSIAGIALFVFGMMVNIHSDQMLRNLRKPGEFGYKIPRGGMFEYISGANFFGEILTWIGFALFAQSLPAFAFAVFATCNVGPRALHHHRWYRQKFDDYPKSRKALIPFVL